MADNYTRLADTISAHEGKAYININGNNRELFEISSLKAQLEMVIQEKRMLGNRMMQHKVIGANGTGSATLYFMNSEQLKNAMDYISNGNRYEITLQVSNEDPLSTIGKQEVTLKNVIFKTVPITSIAESDDPVTFDSDFTFDEIVKLDPFKLPTNYIK